MWVISYFINYNHLNRFTNLVIIVVSVTNENRKQKRKGEETLYYEVYYHEVYYKVWFTQHATKSVALDNQ